MQSLYEDHEPYLTEYQNNEYHSFDNRFTAEAVGEDGVDDQYSLDQQEDKDLTHGIREVFVKCFALMLHGYKKFLSSSESLKNCLTKRDF